MALATDRTANPLGIVLPIAIVITVLGYMAHLYFGDITRASFLPFAMTIALFVYLLTFVDIRIGIGILILCIGISPEMAVGGVPNIRLEDFIIPALFAAWITRSVVQREKFQPTVLKGPIIAYIVVVILSAIFGISMGTVSFRTALLVTGKTLEYFLIFLIVLNCLRSERDVKAFIIMAIVISVISCLAGFARATHPTEEGFVFEGRVMGPYGETANILAGYILFHLAIVTGLFLHADRFSYRFILGMIFFLLFYTMLVTFSRTGYIALVGGFILFGLLKKRQFLLMLFVIFILFAIMAPQSVKERMATIIKIPTSTPPPSFAARRAAWEAAFDRVTLSPIFGFGPGYTPLGWVDNEYIRVMQDLGFLGLAVFLWFLYKLGRQAFHVCGRVRHDWLIRGYTVGFLIAFLSILVHALGATSFTSIRTMEIFMVLTALFVSIANNYRQWEAEHTHHRRHSRHHHRVKHKRIGIS